MSASLRHLLVDARPVDHPTARQRGIGRYVTGLLRGLQAIDAPFTALVGSDLEAGLLADVVDARRIEAWSPSAVRERAEHGTWYLATQLMLHPVALDPIPATVTAARLPVAAVMYDVIPYRHPEVYQVEPAARRLAQVRAPLARTLDAMLAISQFAADTAADELDFPRDRIVSIGAGVEPQFVPAGQRTHARPDRVLPADVSDYVVAVTGGDERKNTSGLLAAWGRLPGDVRVRHRLVVVAAHTPAVLLQWQRWAGEAGVAGDVVFTGAVTDDEMVALLQRACLAVMPSTEEGFGLPVVEAAACGCPVISSDVSSLPEVLEEPAACFDPHDPADMAAAIERGLTDGAHRSVLVDAGRRASRRWTWSNVATAAVDAIAELGPRWESEPRRPPLVLGLAGPFEGSDSGIGRYDVAVADALETVIDDRTDDRTRRDPWSLRRFVDVSGTPEPVHGDANRWPARAIGRFVPPWDVDHLVAVLGSSHHHVAVADLAVRVPSHVWLHDVTLVGVHLGVGHLSGSHEWARHHAEAAIRANEGDGMLARLGEGRLDPDRLAAEGVTLLRETLRRARSVIVSSDRGARIVRRVRPDGPPVLVLPHAFPELRLPSGPPATSEIVAAGWLDANKSPELAIATLAALVNLPGCADSRLAFVGQVVGGTATSVIETAQRAGVADRIEIVGRLDDVEFRERLATARVGLQLRATHRGEMSGAIADLVACGVPTVTNLSTTGASSDGVRVVPCEIAADELAATLADLVADDDRWRAASADALARAGAWTFGHVAEALVEWLGEVDRLAPDTVRHVGPADLGQ